MPMVIVDDAEHDILLEIFDEDFELHAFTNNVTPSETDTVSTYTEASGGGYSSKSLATAGWDVTDSVASFAEQTWDFSGAVGGSGIIYGVYLTWKVDDRLFGAFRFSTPFTPIADSSLAVVVSVEAD